MAIELVHVGFGHIVVANRLLAILPGTSPARGSYSLTTRNLIREARKNSLVVDMTSGRRTKSVLVMDTGHIVLVAMSPKTVATRLAEAPRGRGLQTWQEEEE